MGFGTLRASAALYSGIVFGLGLAVSGMMNPAKVIGFLDLAGNWDPTLAFVIGGAMVVTIPAFRIILKRRRPVLTNGFALPKKSAVDARLASSDRAKVWVYRFLIVVVVLSIIDLIIVDSTKYLQHV